MQQDFFADRPVADAVKRVAWVPTRQAGLDRLAAFAPFAGRAYAYGRNTDRGRDDRSNVSALSPWIRRRLITEEEVLAAVLKQHSPASAEKFIQEVFWRTYWKGWLEMRPTLLRDFDVARISLKEQALSDTGLRVAVAKATQGQTGIECFDAWVTELIETGWLHNHTRMWFASIWIFTFKLPWQLGADFFFKHLLDADPASNTLSWRWVAGLQTQGKNYLARASNIKEHTLGRFDPRGLLDETAHPLAPDGPIYSPGALLHPQEVRTSRVAVLLHDDDLHPESLDIPADVVAVGALRPTTLMDAETPASRFTAGAIGDALARSALRFAKRAEPRLLSADEIVTWANDHGVNEVVSPYAPVGLNRWSLDALEPKLVAHGIRLTRVRRSFDSQAWPFAKSGFFKFKSEIPKLLNQLRGA
jgi:deoxyribodipyrimidine photo-lyase